MRTISLGRKLLYAATLMALAFVGLEGVVRVRTWIRYGGKADTRDSLMHYDGTADLFVPTPGYELKGSRIHIKINSLGFRGDEFSREKPAGTLRIAVLGASTTFNAEVSSNAMTWPHQLQEMVRAAYPAQPIEVINASLGGYISVDNLKNLRHRVLTLSPDLVIYYEANNEIVRDTGRLAQQRGLVKDGRRPAPITALSKYSLLIDLAYKNLTILAGESGGPSVKIDAVPADLPTRFLSVLDDMRQELDARGIPFMLSTFIVKYRRDQDRALQVANADVAFYYMPWMSIEGMLDAMDVYNQAILDYASKHNLMVVDDRAVIPADGEHFADCMHLTDRGASVMADRFLRYFRENQVIERLQGNRRGRPAA